MVLLDLQSTYGTEKLSLSCMRHLHMCIPVFISELPYLKSNVHIPYYPYYPCLYTFLYFITSYLTHQLFLCTALYLHTVYIAIREPIQIQDVLEQFTNFG